MSKLYLKRNEERRILSGHLWVFSNEIERIENSAETGDLIEVYSSKDSFLGTGFYNKSSLISVRLLKNPFDGDIFSYLKTSIIHAQSLRDNIYPGRSSYRLVFSESDYLPGLIIDKYNNTYVLQVHSAGMNMNIHHVVDVLKKELSAENIFSRNDFYFRRLEGLNEEDEIYLGEAATEVISDGKITYKINFSSSQKTGFYFDQSDNREFIERIAKGKTVLDAFCNSGGFGMHAAYSGAESVTFVDSSTDEIENAKVNYGMNKLNANADFIVSDVFDLLEKCISEERKFGIVIIDPPAFAKSRKSIPAALKGYEKLNKLALNCTEGGGYLVTSSCSHHVKDYDFLEAITKSEKKANKQLQLIYKSGAALDHPQIPAMEETSYLKFMVFKVS